MKPHTIVSLGIARTFQSIRLFPTLPLVENVLAGRHCRMHSGIIGSMFHTPAQRREERAALERAMNELEFGRPCRQLCRGGREPVLRQPAPA